MARPVIRRLSLAAKFRAHLVNDLFAFVPVIAKHDVGMKSAGSIVSGYPYDREPLILIHPLNQVGYYRTLTLAIEISQIAF